MGDGGRPGALGDEAFAALVARSSPDVVAVIDEATTVVWCNDQVDAVLGIAPEDLVGTSVLDLLHPDDVDLAATVLAGAALAQPELRPARYRLRRADATWIDVEAQGHALDLPDGTSGVIVSARPFSQRVVDVLASLASGRAMDETVSDILDSFLSSRTGTVTVVTWHDEHGRNVVCHGHAPVGLLAEGSTGDTPESLAVEGESVRVTDLTGLDRGVTQAAWSAGFSGFVTLGLADPGGFPQATVTQWSADPRILELLALGAIGEPAWALRLALQLRHYRRQLEVAAHTDPLTGVANRAGLFEALEGGRLADGPVAMLYVDLDGFKPVNDDHGHATGDEVLVVTAAPRSRSGATCRS